MTLSLSIPAYNAAAYLPRLLKSAREQSIPFDEIIVYNDCSTDNTEEVAKAFGVKVVNGDRNRGCSYGKNKLAEASDCSWIHFHDADDELLPNFTELAHAWMKRADCPDVVLFDYEYRENECGELITIGHFDDAGLVTDQVRYAILNQINPFCGLYKKSRLIEVGGYDTDPEILYNEDVAFHCKLAIAGFSFRAENTISIINYKIGNSMSAANQLKCAQAHYHVMKNVASKVGDKYGAEIAQKLWKNAVNCAAMGDWNTCRKSLTLARKLKKIIPENERMLLKISGYFFPYWTIKVREAFIRLKQPQLRSHLGNSR